MSNFKAILNFWFVGDRKRDEYKHQAQRWFKLSHETDELIRENFGELLKNAEEGKLDHWKTELDSFLALIILLDQFSRNIYRGTEKMFSNDSKAIEICRELISRQSDFDQLSVVEKFFVYLPFLHSEDLITAKFGLDGMQSITDQSPTEQKTSFFKYLNNSKIHHELLVKFGRYPHRNLLLGRESTDEELEFLRKSTHNFVKSVQPIKKPTTFIFNADSTANSGQVEKDAKKQRRDQIAHQSLLFLHGFRQSSNKLKKRLVKLLKHLKEECNTSVTFLNGTHPYKPDGEIAGQTKLTLGDLALNPIESQRVWFNSDDNAEVYNGIDEALHHILIHVKSHPQYDGIVGFGQGATLATIFTRLHPSFFRYCILISAFQPRSIKHAPLFTPDSRFDLPSLHIFGENDILINPSRSELFSKCFKDPKVCTHKAGHFAPDSWPIDDLTQFILNQTRTLNPILFEPNQTLHNKINHLNFSFEKFQNQNSFNTLFQHIFALDLFNSDEFKSLNFTKLRNSFVQVKNDSKTIIDDKLVLIYLLILLNKKETNINDDNNEVLRSILQLWIDLYLSVEKEELNAYLIESIESLFVSCEKFKELILLCSLAYRPCQAADSDQKLTFLYNYLIEKFFRQLVFDLSLVDEVQGSFHLPNLTSLHLKDPELTETKATINKILNQLKNNLKSYEEEVRLESYVSDLAKFLPRVKSSIDRKSRIGREVANLLNNYKQSIGENLAKIFSYNHYRKILSIINRFKESRSKMIEMNANPSHFLYLARYNKSAMELLMSAPFSNAILNPVPEPVDISSREQLAPLFAWLKLNQLFDENEMKFLKGTVTLDGRLDLCKQVIGPNGIEPLLDSMSNSKQVDRLLLGNNIIGDSGGRKIADFIQSGKSSIRVWYIAGNRFTSEGIKPICDALLNDKQVTGLWLKRNPLKQNGMKPVADLLRVNTNIQVLDLLNCGLLDAGVEVLFSGLRDNRTVKHLYLSANGITPIGLGYVRAYFKSGGSVLESLYLGANRIGDEGAKIVSDLFEFENKLERVNLASSRIGAEGMRWLSTAKLDNLKLLDLGYMRATMDFGELGNFIEDSGAEYLGDLLKRNTKLLSLNITHNHVTQKGMQKLVDAIKLNESLVYLDYIQFGVSLNEITLSCLRSYLERNRKNYLSKFKESDLEEVLMPEHVKEIYSVYRTH